MTTAPLNLLHVPVNARTFTQWAHAQMHHNDEKTIPGGDIDYGVSLHRLLSGSFGKGVVQPFRLFAPQTGKWSLYGYSAENADALKTSAATFMMPDMADTLEIASLKTKPMPTSFSSGTRLGFDLLARPIRRLKGCEKDAYIFAAETARAKGEVLPQRAQVYETWLGERLAPACALETCRISQIVTSQDLRNGKPVTGPRVTFQGTVRVTDSEAFSHLLRKGVGRHKAYGYGMLLLRPADRS